MFNTYVHNFIDQVQNTKKEFVKHAVKHDQFSNILNTFIDAQTKYTKDLADANIDIMTSVAALLINKDIFSQKWYK